MPIDFFADKLSLTWIVLFVLFIIFPGLVSMRIFRLMAPAKEMDWKNASYESAFLGTINLLIAVFAFAILYTIDSCVNYISGYSFFDDYTLSAGLVHTFLFLIVVAIGSPFFWVRIREWMLFKQVFLAHNPSAWDFYFAKRQKCFVLVHLKNGGLIGGYFGENSFATSFPEPLSIYIEKVLKVDESGNFDKYTDHSNGIVLCRDDFDYLEFFSIPTQTEKCDGLESELIEKNQCQRLHDSADATS